MFDDDQQRQIYEAAKTAAEAQVSTDGLCQLLGQFRAGLIGQGFTTEGAEGIVRDFYCSTLDAAAQAREEADGGDD